MSQHLSFSSSDHPIRGSAQEVPGVDAKDLRPAIILLHGSGGNVDLWSARLGSGLQAAGVHLYAPHYFERTGTVRANEALLTDGVHVPRWLETIDEALRFVASRPGVDPRRIVLAGISLGAFLAMALAAQLSSASADPAEASRIRALIEISGGLVPPYDRLATSLLPPTLVLHGEADSVVPVSFAHALLTRLSELGVPHQSVLLPGEGHWFGPSAWAGLLTAVSSFLQPLLT